MDVLVRVAEAGSMTRAARQLGLTPAAVSALVQRVEGELGLRLFERTTRSLHATREGRVIVEGCEEALDRWRRALDEAHGSDAVLEGPIRLAAPADTTHVVVSDAIAAFCQEHPGVRIVVHPTDALQDVLGDALDLTIRYGELKDGRLIARRLVEMPRVLVAAPTYLAEQGTPASVDDLARHRLLTLQLGNAPELAWTLREGGRERQVPVSSPMCGDGLLVRRWAVEGHGVALKGLLDVVDDLEAGRLVRVLPDVDGGVGAIHAVVPSRPFLPARVRRFVDLLVARFSERARRCEPWR